ncbi:S8 family serine peptidase [Arundinibacter roseus]|uniref:Peptidase S8 n=1 Tax=Arundinibacter roseus TaxID=2070510 RepID=A0A4R4KA06_9BACT|nr:S8 family serine peptidase [Arundinibacter roseus]TDB64628.1 peptidase S8 [Arundinibacter roseus]
MRIKTWQLLFVLLTSTLSAQPKYWIYLSDKDPNATPVLSETTLENRKQAGLVLWDETDLPVRSEYFQAIQKFNITPLYASRWLNAISAALTPQQATTLRSLNFVTDVVPMDVDFVIARTAPADRSALAPVMSQVQSEAFKSQGFTGKGVTVGVIDAGFYGADSSHSLQHVFSNKRVLGIRDYVKPNQPAEWLYTLAESYSDMHGTEVMAAISGFDIDDQVQYGTALNAKFYLARTDYSLREWRGEEDNWIAAMEWMDSLGVRLINTSLGYARGFSDPKENYEPKQMDGKTSAISRAAQLAVDKKGILLVVSAGNEGEDKNWRIISTPADAKGVLAVGATNMRLWNRIGYSSMGPEFLPYIKPNVSCFSLYGTSLSAPVITGFAACLMEANPKLTNKELMDLIEKSAHLYPYGNNFVGYGVPLASKALALVKAPYLPSNSSSVKVSGKTCTIDVVTSDQMLVIYRKKNKKDVISQQIAKVQDGKITLKKQNGEAFTTVDLKDRAIEVIWE